MVRQDVALRMGLTAREWFWMNVDASGGQTACWEWRGSRTARYPNIRWDGAYIQAHRLAYTLAKGDPPEGAFICHACDNPRCCNPDHLWVGTHQDNMDDMMSKGRWNGGRRMRADEPLLLIVNARLEKGESLTKIADDIGTSRGALIRAFRASKTVKRTTRKPDAKGGRPASISAEKLDRIRLARSRGQSITQIAKAEGVSRAAIYRAFERGAH